jgi:PAS domain S-box-containing protein
VTEPDSGEIRNANDRFLEMVSYERDELIGQTPPELGMIEEKDWEDLMRGMDGHDRHQVPDVQLTTADGKQVEVRMSSEIIERETGVVLFHSVVSNTTTVSRKPGS